MIAHDALVLTTDASQLHSGLDSSASKVNHFFDSTAKKAEGAGSRFAGLGKFAAGGIAGLVAGLGLESITGVVEKFTAVAEKADGAAKAARSLGTSTENFMGLQHAANLSGISLEQLQTGLSKYRQKVSGDLLPALQNTADSLMAIQDPGERAKAAVQAFGKAGVGMLPMLEGGKQGLSDMVEEAKKLGVALGSEDTDKIEEANDAMTRVKEAGEGLVNKLLVSFSPLIKIISDKLTGALTYLAPLFEWVGRAAETYYGIVLDVWSEIGDLIMEGYHAVKDFFAQWGTGAVEIPKVEEVITFVLRNIGKGIAYVYDTVKALAGVFAYAGSYALKYLGEPFINTIQDMLSVLKELPDAVRPDWIDRATGALDKAKAKIPEMADELKKAGKDWILAWGTSSDAVDKWFNNRKKPDAKKKEAQDIGAEIGEAAGLHFSEAMIKGSKQAYQTEINFQLGKTVSDQNAQIDALLQLKGLSQEVVNELQQARHAFEKMAEKIGDDV
jgi:hypothetical protein